MLKVATLTFTIKWAIGAKLVSINSSERSILCLPASERVRAGHLPGGRSGVLRSATFAIIIIQVEALFYCACCHKAVRRCHI